jgi:hypothetical protein
VLCIGRNIRQVMLYIFDHRGRGKGRADAVREQCANAVPALCVCRTVGVTFTVKDAN